jgi:hypothetical protein
LNGGYPLRLDDLIFLQSNVEVLTSEICKAYGYSEFKISGCEISVTDSGGSNPLLNITAGAIYKDNSIYLVDAVTNSPLASGTTLNDITSLYEWDLSVVNSSARIFADSLTKEVNYSEKAILVSGTTTWSGVIANLISHKDILKHRSNLDILNRDYENPANFTLLYDDALGKRYRSYQLLEGQHILRLYTPSGSTCSLTNIIPHSNMYDGYELTVEIKKHPTANRGFELYGEIAGGNVTSNINLVLPRVIATTNSVLPVREPHNINITFNTTQSDMYVDNGVYDINLSPSGSFKVLLRWNNRTNQWGEVSRTKHNS